MTILIWVWFRVGNPNWTYSIDIFRWLFSLLTETRTRAFDFTQVRSKDDGLSNPVFKKYIIEKYNLTDLEKLLEKSGNTKELNTILIDVKNLNNFSRLEKELAVLYKKEKAASIVQPSNNVTKPKSFYERTLKPSLLPLKYTQYFATHESYTQRLSNLQFKLGTDWDKRLALPGCKPKASLSLDQEGKIGYMSTYPEGGCEWRYEFKESAPTQIKPLKNESPKLILYNPTLILRDTLILYAPTLILNDTMVILYGHTFAWDCTYSDFTDSIWDCTNTIRNISKHTNNTNNLNNNPSS